MPIQNETFRANLAQYTKLHGTEIMSTTIYVKKLHQT